MTNTVSSEKILTGIGCAPGICIGKAYLVDRGDVDPIHQYAIEDIESEKRRFRNAVHLTEEELLGAIDTVPTDLKDNANILKAHVLLLKDKLFFTKIVELIGTKKVNAEWALKCVATQLQQLFFSMTDSYLKERAYDIRHIAGMVLKNLRGSHTPPTDISSIDKRVILVAKDLSPAQASQIQLNRILGLITQDGGVASHTSIIARTLGLPAVAGIENCTLLVEHGEVIIADGIEGKVILSPSEETLHLYQDKKTEYYETRTRLMRESQEPVRTTDDISLTILGNIDFPEEISTIHDVGGEGIGLYRTEFQYLNQSRLPSEEELYDRYAETVRLLNPGLPIIIRTMDINGDKALLLKGGNSHKEANPALGLRGIRYGIRYPDEFTTQIRAILRAAAIGNVHVMFPLVSNVEEVRFAKRLIQKTALELEKEGIPHNAHLPVGVMIEVPSAVMIADILAKEADFFSIGTNDLIQYAIAIDRSNTHVADLFQPLSPAVIRMLYHTIQAAKEAQIDISVCGEMAGIPMYLPMLLGLGIRKFSMNAFSIPAVKNLLRQLSITKAEDFVKEALQLSTTNEIDALLQEQYGSILQGK